MSNKTFFGYKQVNKQDKAKMVHNVFSSVASSYDVMNDAMSFGIHRLWKNKMVNSLNIKDGNKIIDMAGGTGDIAFRMKEKAKNSHITICDINENMLHQGRNRAIDRNILKNIEFRVCDAEKLPFEDEIFDHYTIAFGIRNVTNIDNALKEAFRVLKFGGRFTCLEFSKVENRAFAKIYDKFSFHLIPKMGQLLAKDADSYQYLVESIRKFPNQETFSNMILDAGFEDVKYENFTNGIVAMHVGWKI